MKNKEIHELEIAYLRREVFGHLANLNVGFDSSAISYFDEHDFALVLHRIQELGLGIYGIEPFKEGEYYGVAAFEEYGLSPTDPTWYMTAFERFKSKGVTLQYSASYHIPEHLLI